MYNPIMTFGDKMNLIRMLALLSVFPVFSCSEEKADKADAGVDSGMDSGSAQGT